MVLFRLRAHLQWIPFTDSQALLDVGPLPIIRGPLIVRRTLAVTTIVIGGLLFRGTLASRGALYSQKGPGRQIGRNGLRSFDGYGDSGCQRDPDKIRGVLISGCQVGLS